jgi:hypothetical protein
MPTVTRKSHIKYMTHENVICDSIKRHIQEQFLHQLTLCPKNPIAHFK